MQLVKIDESVVQVIGREQNEFTIITREREVKRISANHIHKVSERDIQRTLKEMKINDVVYLPEYRKYKKYLCSR